MTTSVNYRMFRALTALALFFAIFISMPIALSTAAEEQPATPVATTTAAPATREMTAADVEAFLDGIMPVTIERENIAGATVSIVKDGKLLFSKGYGYADVATKKPVTADGTLFRPGSVSKLFTWTAVMQMQEQGKLDLKKDVNEYLDFKIPDAFGQPITLENILTHTPGFEEQIKDLFVTGTESPDLGNYVKTHMPTRIYPPGKVPAYSNYATALAGYIVERVSGKPFSQYVDENIFKPLGMTKSSFVQPLPANLVDGMSSGYRLGSDKETVPYEMVTAFPAGSLASTADDMSKFMLAHLQDGELNGQRILKPETAKLMHTRLFGLDDAAQGMAHGFYEENQNGLRIVGHGGDTIAFHSDLHLLLDKGVGFFVSYNSGGKGEANLRSILFTSFLDRYYPFTLTGEPVTNAKEEAQKVAGTYLGSRRAETSFLRIASLLGEGTVAPNEDGTISTNMVNDANGQPRKWQAMGGGKFRDVNGQEMLIFKPDHNGVMQLILAKYPFMTFTKVGVSENAGILLPVLGISLGIMLLTLVLAPIAWIVRRRYGSKLAITGLDAWLRRFVWVVFALDIVFIVALVALTMYGLSHIEVFSDSGTRQFHMIQIVGIIGALGTFIVLFYAIRTWLGSYSIWSKLRSLIFVLACIGFLWFAYVGNLLILRSTY